MKRERYKVFENFANEIRDGKVFDKIFYDVFVSAREQATKKIKSPEGVESEVQGISEQASILFTAMDKDQRVQCVFTCPIEEATYFTADEQEEYHAKVNKEKESFINDLRKICGGTIFNGVVEPVETDKKQGGI